MAKLPPESKKRPEMRLPNNKKRRVERSCAAKQPTAKGYAAMRVISFIRKDKQIYLFSFATLF